MGDQTIIEKIKDYIGCLAFGILMWSLDTTRDQYYVDIANYTAKLADMESTWRKEK